MHGTGRTEAPKSRDGGWAARLVSAQVLEVFDPSCLSILGQARCVRVSRNRSLTRLHSALYDASSK